MTKVRKNILLISIFFCVVIFPACFFSQVNLTNYPPSLDGLQSANCFDLLQDKKGVLWIATEDGLSRFNGTQFIAIRQKDGLSNDLIHDLEIFNAHLSKAVKSSDENMIILKEEYDNWRGDIPPVDDVLVIGFQI